VKKSKDSEGKDVE